MPVIGRPRDYNPRFSAVYRKNARENICVFSRAFVLCGKNQPIFAVWTTLYPLSPSALASASIFASSVMSVRTMIS